MPSNKELAADATELAKALGLDVETDGLKNDELAALVSDLKAKTTDADTDTAADVAEDKATSEAHARKGKPKQVKKPPFYVAPRKALTSKRGILSGDTADEVKVEYLEGGQEALDNFIKSGHILKG